MYLFDRWPLMMAEGGGDGAGSSGFDAGTGDASLPAEAATDTRTESLVNAGTAGSLLDWRSTLPDAVRNAPIITRHATMEAAAKSLIAQDAMMGRGLFLPTEAPDTDEYRVGMQKIYDKLGRPGKPDEYTLKAPEGKAMDSEVA